MNNPYMKVSEVNTVISEINTAVIDFPENRFQRLFNFFVGNIFIDAVDGSHVCILISPRFPAHQTLDLIPLVQLVTAIVNEAYILDDMDPITERLDYGYLESIQNLPACVGKSMHTVALQMMDEIFTPYFICYTVTDDMS